MYGFFRTFNRIGAEITYKFGVSAVREWDSRNNDANTDASFECVCRGYERERLGQPRREVDVRNQYDTGSCARRYFIMPDPRLRSTRDTEKSDFALG